MEITSANTKLVQLTCPSCGGKLIAEESTKKLVCQSCNNLVVPVMENSKTLNSLGSMQVKIDGINNPSSGIAFIEQYFQNFDWETFQLDTSIFTIPTIDRIVENLKVSSADNPQTWILQFEAIATPFEKKILGTKIIENQIENLFQPNETNEAYSKFDNLQTIIVSLKNRKQATLKSLSYSIELYLKYGGESNFFNQLKNRIKRIEIQIDSLNLVNVIEDLPAIKVKKESFDFTISKKLNTLNIDVDKIYDSALNDYKHGELTKALNQFLSLEGYKDSYQFINRIQHNYQFDTYLEINNKPFIFDSKESGFTDASATKSLFRIEHGIGKQPPIVDEIKHILKVYGNKLFFINQKSEICSFNQLDNKISIIGKFISDLKDFQTYQSKLGTQERFLVSKESINPSPTDQTKLTPNNPNPNRYYISVLDYSKETFEILLKDVDSLVNIIDERIVYFSYAYDVSNSNYANEKGLYVFNIETKNQFFIGNKEIEFREFYQDFAIALRKKGSDSNFDLLAIPLQNNSPEIMIESNVFDYFKVIDNRFYYNVGNEANHSLISNNLSSNLRLEVLRYMKEILFTQGQYLFILQGNQYQLGLIRFDTQNNSNQSVISDLEEIYGFKYGYIFYKDSENSLCRVRIDGANQQILSGDLGQIVTIKNNFIYYSIEENESIKIENDSSSLSESLLNQKTPESNTSKKIRSLYRMNADGHAKQKLAYNILNAKEYDDHNIDYIVRDEKQNQIKKLYRLNVDSLKISFLTQLGIEKEIFKSKEIAALLGVLFGYIGLHNFYINYRLKGLVQILVVLLSLLLNSSVLFFLSWITAVAEVVLIYIGFTKKSKDNIPIR
jgi:TM2 domain-containing membrane protein YozV